MAKHRCGDGVLASQRGESLTELLIIPQTHFAVAVLANLEHAELRDLVRAILGEMQQPLPARPKP